MSRPKSFRLSETLIARLDDCSRRRGETATALAERYLEEGLRRESHPLVAFRDGAVGRRAALVGTRLDVAQVIDTLRESGNAVDATADYLEIPIPSVRAAISYYAEFKTEVDEWRERTAAISDQEREAWLREQAVLT